MTIYNRTTNKRVRDAIKAKRIPAWQVSLALGMADGSLSSLLTTELPKDKQDELIDKIKNINVDNLKIPNLDIRNAIERSGIKYYSVAEYLEMSPMSFSKLLRRELPEDTRKDIFNAIDHLVERPSIFTDDYDEGFKDGYEKGYNEAIEKIIKLAKEVKA